MVCSFSWRCSQNLLWTTQKTELQQKMATDSDDSPSTEPNLTWKLMLIKSASRLINFAIQHSDLTIIRRLLDFFDLKSAASDEPIDGVKSSDITFDSSNNLWFRLYAPSPSTTTSLLPLIVYYHGGGFVIGAANSRGTDFICRRLAAVVSAVVVSVDYRRSPQHRFPVPYDDGFRALKFIDDVQNASVLPASADLSRCFLAGESAGGNIAHHVAVRANEYEFRRLRISGIVAIQPFFGGEERTGSELRFSGGPMLTLDLSDIFWNMFLPEGSDRDHEAANVGGPNSKDLTAVKFPATLVVIGGYDLLQDSQRRYGEWLRKCGKQVEFLEITTACHGFYAFVSSKNEVPEFTVVLKEIHDFIHRLSSQRR